MWDRCLDLKTERRWLERWHNENYFGDIEELIEGEAKIYEWVNENQKELQEDIAEGYIHNYEELKNAYVQAKEAAEGFVDILEKYIEKFDGKCVGYYCKELREYDIKYVRALDYFSDSKDKLKEVYDQYLESRDKLFKYIEGKQNLKSNFIESITGGD